MNDLDFNQWCTTWGLEDCDLVPQDPESIPQKTWEAITGSLDEILNSPSSLSIDRQVYDSQEVQNLFLTLELQGFLELVSEVNWTGIYGNSDDITLESSTATDLTVRGLTVTLDELVSLIPQSPGSFALSGVTIASESESLGLDFLSVANFGYLDVEGSDTYISGIPYEFLDDGTTSSIAGIEDVVAALKEVLFSNKFDFRQLLSLQLSDSNIENIATIINPVLPEDQYGDALKVIVGSLSGVAALGSVSGETLAEAYLETPFTCAIGVNNIPILGSLSLNVNIDDTVGAENLRSLSDGLKIDFFGISTSLGNLNSISLEGTQLTISIGWFVNIAIDLDPEGGDDNGPEIESVSCSA